MRVSLLISVLILLLLFLIAFSFAIAGAIDAFAAVATLWCITEAAEVE